MVTVLKAGTTEEQKRMLIKWFEDQGLRVHEYENDNQTVLGLIGDTSGIDVEMLELLDIVEHVALISEPFKKANRKFHPEDSVIDVRGRFGRDGGADYRSRKGGQSVRSHDAQGRRVQAENLAV